MLKNFGELIFEVQEYLGMTALDATSTPTLSRVKSFINDSVRETLSEFNYKQLETSCQYPFLHTINDVQGAYLSGTSTSPLVGSGITASIIPYPANNLLVNCQENINYSGIVFTGQDGLGNTYTGISTSGSQITGSVSTVGYQYELQPDIDQIYSITLPFNSYKLSFMPQYDFDRAIPQGLTISSGTPSMYTTFPGLSASGNIVVQFYPQPVATTYSGISFIVHYKRKHQDMVALTDIQRVLPEQFQDLIIDSTLEKTFSFLSDEKSVYHKARKMERSIDLKIWAENNLDYVNIARDGDFLSSPNASAYNTSVQFRI